MKLQGAFTAMITPMKSDGSVDYDGLRENVRWQLKEGIEGLVHISRLDVKRTEKVEDVVNVGDSIIVKCIEIDDQGRINLSRRDALIELEGMTPENDIDEAPRKPRRDNRNRRHN